MAAVLSLVYWPDVFDSSGPAGWAPLLVRRIHSRLTLLGDAPRVVVWTGSGCPRSSDPFESALAAFARAGWQVLPGDPDPDTVSVLSAGATPGDDLVAVMSQERASSLERLCPHRSAFQTWPAGGEGSQSLLASILRIGDVRPVAVFADGAAIRSPDGAPLGRESWRALFAAAEQVGPVVFFRVHEDGQTWEICSDGRRTAAMPSEQAPCTLAPGERLRAEVCELLGRPHRPSHWTLATGASWLPALVEEISVASDHVTLWSNGSCRIPMPLAARIESHLYLPDILHLEIRPAPDPESQRSGEPLAGPRQNRAQWRPVEAPLRCSLDEVTGTAFELMTAGLETRLSQQGEGVVVAIQDALAERGRLHGLIAPDPESAEPVEHIQHDHPACRGALLVSEQVIRVLQEMLARMPWVSYTLLRGVLVRDQRLGGHPFCLAGEEIDAWLNHLIRKGVFRVSRETNPVPPGYPVTALHLNEEHPFTAAVVREMGEASQLLRERVLLTIHLFLQRTSKPWMSMASLYRALDYVSRETLKSVIDDLCREEALLVELHANPRGEHRTTGCRLQMESSLVREVLSARQAFADACSEADPDQWIELARVLRRLDPSVRASGLAWAILLRDCGAIELRPRPLPPDAAPENIYIRGL